MYTYPSPANAMASRIELEHTDPGAPFFPGNLNDIHIATAAVDAAEASIAGLVKRLGLNSMYGGVDTGNSELAPVSGVIEETSRAMRHLIERACELRGLCEMVAAKL